MDFIFTHRTIGHWDVPVIELPDATHGLCLSIMGQIANSISTGQSAGEHLREWKKLVASQVKDSRGVEKWNPNNSFAISLGLSFCPALHGNQALDVENFIKPIIDALAAGLFCEADTDPQDIQHWSYDDSNFSTLLIHRLPDADRPENEGIAVCVSSKPK